MSGWDNRPDGATRFQLEPTAQPFRPKSPQLQFSSGYGLRDQVQPRETGPLPPEEERIGPDGSRHRLYPAPSPIEPPINMNEGWSNTETSAPPNVAKSIHSDNASTHKANDGGWDVPSTHNSGPPPRQRGGYNGDSGRAAPAASIHSNYTTPSQMGMGDGGPTAYVEWKSGADTEKVMASNKELEEQFARYRQGSGGRADMFGIRPGPTDNGYGNRGPAGAARGGYGSGQQDSGWGNRGGGGGASHNQNDPWEDNAGYSRDPPPHRGGGGNSCHNCGREGHFSRECPDGAGPTCYRCHETGHMSSSCPKGGNSGGCYNCGEDGHMSRECPSKGSGGGGGGACYNCNEVGHMSRDCPTKGSVRCYNCNQDGHISRDCPQGGGGGGNCTCYKCGEEGHFSRECPTGGGGGGYGSGGGGGYGGYGDAGYSRDTAGADAYGAGANNSGGGSGWDNDGGANKGDADGWGAPAVSSANAGNHGNNTMPPPSRDDSGWGAGSAPNNTSNNRGGNEGGWGDAQSNNNFAPNTSNFGPNTSAPPSSMSEPRGLQVHPDRLRQMDPQLASRSSQGTGNTGSYNPNNGGNAGPRSFGPNSEQILRHPRGPPAEPRTSWDERRAAAPSNEFGGGQDNKADYNGGQRGYGGGQSGYNGGQSPFNPNLNNNSNYNGSQGQSFDNQGGHQANQSGYSGNQGGAPPPAQKAQEEGEFGGW